MYFSLPDCLNNTIDVDTTQWKLRKSLILALQFLQSQDVMYLFFNYLFFPEKMMRNFKEKKNAVQGLPDFPGKGAVGASGRDCEK